MTLHRMVYVMSVCAMACGSTSPPLVQTADSAPWSGSDAAPTDVSAGLYDAGDGGATVSDDAGDGGATLGDWLEQRATQSRGVAVGTVEAVRTDAHVEHVELFGYSWSIYYDEVDLVVERGLGTTVPPRSTILGVPARCEASLDGVPQPDVRLSTCSPRDPALAVARGARVLVFTGGPGASLPRQLTFLVHVDARGVVDLSGVGGGEELVDVVWGRIERARGR
jgi:hypothetical protein